MKYWIDDRRDPKDSLGKESEQVVWLKEIIPAIHEVEDNASEVEVLYLDHYMDSDHIFGSELIMIVLCMGKETFPKLEKIYLHTSENTIIKRLVDKYSKRLADMGIQLLEAKYRH